MGSVPNRNAMLTRWIFALSLAVLCYITDAQNAPVTSLPDAYTCIPGEISIPVSVTNFDGIGAISLSLEFDASVMTFVQGIQNSAFTGAFAIGDNLLPSGLHSLIIGWFGTGVSLPDGATLIDLKFSFNGGTTSLSWFDDGASCEYTDAAYNTLNDLPTACHYRNGIVTDMKCLNLTFLLQGLYNPAVHSMNSALGSGSVPCSEGIADAIQVELHNAANYALIAFSGTENEVSLSGNSRVLVPASLNSNYYITVRHRNSIATVSSVPVSFSSSQVSYDFTDGASRAYGSNMVQMADGKWAFYAGDVNQDGAIDTGDMSPVDNDAGNFASGYLPTDVNGDGSVDTGDMTLIDNNASGFVGSITP